MKLNSIRIPLLCLMLTVAFTSEHAVAQWSLNPTVNNAIGTASSDQDNPTMVSDGSGGAIITWEDYRYGVGYDVFAQKINASGVAQWTANGVPISIEADHQAYPTIVSDGSGGAIITWQDFRSGSNYDIYAQRINASGVVLWTANGVAVSTAAYNQLAQTIVSDGSGGAIITWEDARSSTNYDVYAQKIDAMGAVQWTANGVAISTAAYNQSFPTLVSDGSGGAIITWEDIRSDGVNGDIYAQKINASGVAQWTANGIAISTATYYQLAPTLVSDASGGAIITWHDFRSGTNYDVYAQKIDASGVVQWTADGVAISTAPYEQSSPTIVSDASGGAIIAWYDLRSGSSGDIYTQKIDASGVVRWTTDGVAISTAAHNQTKSTMASDGSGGAIITWEDARSSTNYDVYAQKIGASGVVQWTENGVAISTASYNQLNPTMVSDGSGGAIITWQDYRTGSSDDIYAQKIDPLGNLFGLTPWIDNVGDVANDQGGKLRLFWQPSPLDTWGGTTVTSYTILLGARSSGLFGKTSSTNNSGIYWQEAGSVTARGLEAYTTVVSTLADSGLQGTPYYYFQIIARVSDSSLYRPSNIDSAFSIDNIPPVGIGGASIFSSNSGTITLKWNKDKVDPDLMGYQVYRSSSTGFLLNETTKLALTTDSSYADASTSIGTTYYYRVAAVDVHGNRGTSSSELSIVALSIQLSSFSANLNAHSGVQLEWQTATEIDNSGFGVERRANNSSSWNEIGFVAGNGTSNAPHTYSFVDRQVPAGHTAYRLRQVSSSGTSSYSFSVEMDVIPTTTTLSQNYPNPFNPSTEINYQLADPANVKLTVHDILGREVSSLVNGHQEPGLYQVRWDASTLPSGVYLYRLQTGSSTLVRKMLLQK